MARPLVLALDLEGTLISNAASQIPRPGLFAFLERCNELFPRIAAFTAVNEPRFRAIAGRLVADNLAPAWFAHIEFVAWSGAKKDLRFVPDADLREVLLVDDMPAYVLAGQSQQWIGIAPFEPPYAAADGGLADVLAQVEQRCRESGG